MAPLGSRGLGAEGGQEGERFEQDDLCNAPPSKCCRACSSSAVQLLHEGLSPFFSPLSSEICGFPPYLNSDWLVTTAMHCPNFAAEWHSTTQQIVVEPEA
jgi:hypothetical protein